MYTINSEANFYQVISRDNDINGNPYRLIVIYNAKGLPIQCFEARSSSPDIDNQIWGSLARALNVHVTPKEYSRIKRSIKQFSSVVNGIELSY